MDINQFKAGIYLSNYQYKSFQPNQINLQWIVSSPEINTLLEEANQKLGALDAFSYIVPDVNTFIRMHLVKEATQSSRIEGTQTNIEEAILKERNITAERKDDWREVQNYIQAMDYSLKELDHLPISGRLLKKTHAILLQGVRGKHKQPWEYRTSQNWIGGASLTDAVFIPPVHTSVNDLMSDLEKFLNNEEIKVPALIRIALAHFQFETIHPFLDGNGRLGRLLITLYLVRQKKLHQPTLYISDFLERNKSLYYDKLMVVRQKNDLEQWIKFFLVAVIETASSALETFKSIFNLKLNLEKEIDKNHGKRIKTSRILLDYMFKNPMFTIQDLTEDIRFSAPTANKIVKEFETEGWLKEQTGFGRNRIFSFEAYLSLFR